MSFGQAYGVYKVVQGAGTMLARVFLDSSRQEAEKVGTYAGAYAAYFAAFITADPGGAAAVALDVVNKIDKAGGDSPSP